MAWKYAYTPNIWPSAFTLLLLIVLAVYSGRRHSVPGALPFMIACLFAAVSAASSVMEYTAVDISSKILWVRFQAIWNLPTITAITCFLLEYAWPGRWLTRRNLAILSIPCLLALGLILTNDLHHLVWLSFAFQGSVQPQFGPASWLLAFYVFGVLAVLNLFVCGWLFLRSKQQRWPVVIIIVGQFAGHLLFLAERTNLLHSVLPFDLLGMAFEFLMYAIALFGFRILDPVPLAHQRMIKQLHIGMVVMDPRGKIVSVNPFAQAILGLPERRLLNRRIQELLPIGDEMAIPGQAEIQLGNGEATRHYQLEASSLNDWRGLEAGRLFILQDVTQQKRAQALLLERQQVVATLQERERLARELHDNLGQVLGYVSMQAQAIRKQAREGDLAAIEPQLTRLAEVAQEAHKEIRDSIFGLKSSLTEQWSFFSALSQHLDACQQHYGMRTGLTIPKRVREDAFSPEASVQLLRVIQEALSNAREHGGAGYVQVSFEVKDGSARIIVMDDGCGFDPGQLENQAEGHYGLAFMRERMAQIGGSLVIDSKPGSGTQVILQVPMREGSKEAE